VSAVLLLHAWWGVNADIRAYAERLRAAGFTVATPDLYGGKVARTIPEAEVLRDSIQDSEESIARSRAAVDAGAASLPAPFAVVGFSLGVFYGWDLVRRRPEQVSALVTYYGTAGRPPAQVPPILGHFAAEDEFEPLPAVTELEEMLRAQGARVTHHVYPGTRHWFAEPSRPEHDPAAAELAWERTLGLLRERS
jgi:carboxymethylenebutenolidase